MIVKCDYCSKDVNKKPSTVKEKNFCNKEHRRLFHWRELECSTCGKRFSRMTCQMSPINFCSRHCAKALTSPKMTAMNYELNPTRMTAETRTKVRNARIKEDAVSYPKYYGRHEHRVVAEKMIGRKLKKGEVVHHIDGDKRNNDPLNLMVFKNQAEHALWHKNEKYSPWKNYE